MPVEIIPNLWIGNKADSANIYFLKMKNIKCIINCTVNVPFNKSIQYDNELKKIECIRIPVNDNPAKSYIEDNKYLYEHIIPIIYHINKYLLKMKTVFVHCNMGKQRSASVIASYLMYYGKIDINTAIDYIRNKKSDCFQPAINFKPMLSCLYKKLNKSK